MECITDASRAGGARWRIEKFWVESGNLGRDFLIVRTYARPLRLFAQAVALSVEIRPLPRLDETSPIEWMTATLAFEHGQFGLAQRFAPAQAFSQSLVVRGHHFARGVIAHRPETHHHRLSSSQEEGSSQSINSFPVEDLAHAGVAGGERNQFRAPEVEVRSLERGEDSLLRTGTAQVGARQGEAGAQERIFHSRIHCRTAHTLLRGIGLGRSIWVLQKETVSRDVQDAGSSDLL